VSVAYKNALGYERPFKKAVNLMYVIEHGMSFQHKILTYFISESLPSIRYTCVACDEGVTF